MSDYIKREDALNASKIVYIEYLETDDDQYIEGEADFFPVVFKKDIEKIPAADVVERKTGKWNGANFHTVECSECGFDIDIMKIDTNTLTHLYHCPNCGADMRGDS